MVSAWPTIDLHDPAVVAAGLQRHPLVRALFEARPKLRKVPFWQSPAVSIDMIASTLDRPAHQLMFLARMHGSTLTREAAEAEVGDRPGAAEILDRAAADLVITGIASIRDGRLVLEPSIAEMLQLPQPAFADRVRNITSEQLQRACARLGIKAGTRKDDRAAAVAAVLTDRDSILAALDQLDDTTRTFYLSLLRLTLESPDLDNPIHGAHATYAVSNRFDRRPGSPVEQLVERLLIGADWQRYNVWIWAESVRALTGVMFPEWFRPEPPPTAPLESDDITVIVDVLHAIDAIVDSADAAAPVGNKTGSRRPPVKHWRAVAKSAGLDGELVVLCGALAIELGLLVPELGTPKGRGRNVTVDCLWHPHPRRVAEFRARSVAERWATLVTAWRTPTLDTSLDAVRTRTLVLALLGELFPGEGVPVSSLAQWGRARFMWLDHSGVVDDVLADLVRLGLVAKGASVGLTPAAQALRADLDALRRLLDHGTEAVTVQADHTIVAPADLATATVIGLRRIADVVSTGAVTVWRLSAERIAAAADPNSFDPLEFLRRVSHHDLPQGVERFVADSMAGSKPVEIREVGCVITSTDPMVIVEAARHRTAKLEVLAPGVAVSPLPEAKVIDVLRSKGVNLRKTASAPVAASKPPKPGSRAAGEAALAAEMKALVPQWIVPHRPTKDPLPEPSGLVI